MVGRYRIGAGHGRGSSRLLPPVLPEAFPFTHETDVLKSQIVTSKPRLLGVISRLDRRRKFTKPLLYRLSYVGAALPTILALRPFARAAICLGPALDLVGSGAEGRLRRWLARGG